MKKQPFLLIALAALTIFNGGDWALKAQSSDHSLIQRYKAQWNKISQKKRRRIISAGIVIGVVLAAFFGKWIYDRYSPQGSVEEINLSKNSSSTSISGSSVVEDSRPGGGMAGLISKCIEISQELIVPKISIQGIDEDQVQRPRLLLLDAVPTMLELGILDDQGGILFGQQAQECLSALIELQKPGPGVRNYPTLVTAYAVKLGVTKEDVERVWLPAAKAQAELDEALIKKGHMFKVELEKVRHSLDGILDRDVLQQLDVSYASCYGEVLGVDFGLRTWVDVERQDAKYGEVKHALRQDAADKGKSAELEKLIKAMDETLEYTKLVVQSNMISIENIFQFNWRGPQLRFEHLRIAA